MQVECVFFFFKQKPAYEVRISDWSSDVCSSDLHATLGWAVRQPAVAHLTGSAQRGGRRATNPDRQRRLHGTGPLAHVGEAPARPLVVGLLSAEGAAHRRDPLLQQATALDVGDAQRLELALHVARPHPADSKDAGEGGERGPGLGTPPRVEVRESEDVAGQAAA